MTWVDFSTTLAFTVLIPSQFLPQISFNDDEEISFRKQHGDNCLPTCTYSKATKRTESIGGTMSKSWPHTDIINGIVVCLNEHFCTNWIISKTAWLKWQCDCFCDCKTLGFLVRVRERMVVFFFMLMLFLLYVYVGCTRNSLNSSELLTNLTCYIVNNTLIKDHPFTFTSLDCSFHKFLFKYFIILKYHSIYFTLNATLTKFQVPLNCIGTRH